MRKTTMFLAAAVALVVAGMLAVGVSRSSARPGATEVHAGSSSTVTIGATLAPPTLDMTTNAAAAIPEVLLYNVYEGLVKLNNKGDIVPLLATSWKTSKSGLVWTFNLRTARFHNGDPFTARDVVFTINRVIAPGSTHPHKDLMEPVRSVKAVNPRTVRITLKHRSQNWLYSMTDSVGVIYDGKAIGDIATHPVGTGPYTFSSLNKGYSATIVRNPRYWGQKPGASKVVFRYYTDPNALINALKAGDIDMIENVPEPQQLSDFKNNSKYRVVQGYTNGEVLLTMNNAHSPLSNVLVRRAITYAINRPQLVKTAYGGYGKLIGSMASPGDPWYVDLSRFYPYDVAKAKQLLKQAGYANGLTLSLKLPPPNYARSSGEFIAAQLQQVGIKTEIENVEWPLWIDQVFSKGNYDLTIVAHVEAHDLIKFADPNYYWHYNNAKVQRLVSQADKAATPKGMVADYRDVQRQITKDAVVNWLFLLPNLEVARSYLQGYPTNAIGLSFDLTRLRRTS